LTAEPGAGQTAGDYDRYGSTFTAVQSDNYAISIRSFNFQNLTLKHSVKRSFIVDRFTSFNYKVRFFMMRHSVHGVDFSTLLPGRFKMFCWCKDINDFEYDKAAEEYLLAVAVNEINYHPQF
jgi:hypothetical protein